MALAEPLSGGISRRAARPAIAPPYPDLVLASGRQAAAHARYIGYRSGGRSFIAFFQKPAIDPHYFDFVWAPHHDRLHGPNVTTTLLSPHLLSQESLQAEADKWRARLLADCGTRKPVAVLIGGPNEAYAFTMAEFERLTTHIVALTAQNVFPMITVSRRSPPAFAAHLRARLARTPHFIWDNAGENPYAALLGLAEHIIVTADSVNMVGEACTGGAPVHVFELAGGNRKFRAFSWRHAGRGPHPPLSANSTTVCRHRPMPRRKSPPPCKLRGMPNARALRPKSQKPLNKSTS